MRQIAVLLLVGVTLTWSCGRDASSDGFPAGAEPAAPFTGSDAAPQIPIPAPPSASGQLTWTAPDGWIEEPPSSPMRRAQYRIPGSAGDASLTVFYFGAGQGGDPQANADRWIGQFRDAEGAPLGDDAVVISDRMLGDTPVLVVEAKGTFFGGGMANAPPRPPQPDHMLLGAVVRGPDANWFFKALGPEETLEEQREGFESLLQSIH